MIELIAFDADDTLWDYEILYHNAKPEVTRLFTGQHAPGEVGQILDEIEVTNLELYGYGIKSYGLSMIEALTDHSDGSVDKSSLQTLIQLIKDMLNSKPELAPQVETVLAELSLIVPLMLLTKGDLFEQERKIERSGLAKYFQYIEIVSAKNEDSYRAITEKYHIAPENFLMVGNSLRSDILPVLAIGGQAVYIPHKHTWSYEIVEKVDSHTDFTQLENLGELLIHVKDLLDQEQ